MDRIAPNRFALSPPASHAATTRIPSAGAATKAACTGVAPRMQRPSAPLPAIAVLPMLSVSGGFHSHAVRPSAVAAAGSLPSAPPVPSAVAPSCAFLSADATTITSPLVVVHPVAVCIEARVPGTARAVPVIPSVRVSISAFTWSSIPGFIGGPSTVSASAAVVVAVVATLVVGPALALVSSFEPEQAATARTVAVAQRSDRRAFMGSSLPPLHPGGPTPGARFPRDGPPVDSSPFRGEPPRVPSPTPRSSLVRARRLTGACALVLASAVALPACSSSSAPSGSTTTTAGGSGDAVKGPPAEATLFAPSASILADLPVLKLIPKGTPVVLAVRDPATILAKLGTLGGFAEAKEPLAKEIDDAAKDLSKDLPELAALATAGVDLNKPAGVLWTDNDLDTAAIFAAVSDEAAMKRWLEERAKQSNGKREMVTTGDAIVLRAKRDVTRAVVLRKGFVFWVRTREKFGLDPKRVTSAADAVAQTVEADSLGADATFTKAIASLAYGAQASLFVNAGRFAEAIVADRAKALETATKGLDDAKAALAAAEAKKRKSAADDAKYEADNAQRVVTTAERRAKQVEVLAAMKDEVPAIAIGIDLGDRDMRMKAFVAMPKPGAVKLFAPLEGPSAVLDASLGAQSAGRFAIDPRVVDFVMEHLGATSFARSVMPTERGKSVLSGLGVDMKELAPLLDGEVSAATHRQKTEPAAPANATSTASANVDAPAGATATAPTPPGASATVPAGAATSAGVTASAPDPAAQSPREVSGFTVIWHVSDPAKASALLEAAWTKLEPTERVTKGQLEHPAPGAFHQKWRPTSLDEHVRLAGSSLLVTTHPAMLDATTDTKPRATWMASADHPTLKQLAAIEGANGILAFDGSVWRSRSNRDPWGSRAGALRDAADFGMLGLLGGGGTTAKSKKLEEQRTALRDQIRDLEKALDKHKDATWSAFAARLGTTALFAKPADGGVAIYGGLFTPEASVTALADAALAAWMSVGPRWEKYGELVDLKKKLREIEDKLDGERQKAMEDLVGDVLRGVGASDTGGLGRGRWGGFDDDLGSLLDDPNGLGKHGAGTTTGGGTMGSGAGRGGGLSTVGTGTPAKKP